MANESNFSGVDKDEEKINITRHDLLANIYTNISTNAAMPTVVNQRLTVTFNIGTFTWSVFAFDIVFKVVAKSKRLAKKKANKRCTCIFAWT